MSDLNEQETTPERIRNTDAESGALIFAVIVVAVLAFVGALVGSIVASYAPGYRGSEVTDGAAGGSASCEAVSSSPTCGSETDSVTEPPVMEPAPVPVPLPAPMPGYEMPGYEMPGVPGNMGYLPPSWGAEFPGSEEVPEWVELKTDEAYYATIAVEVTAAQADINTVISVLNELQVLFRIVAIDGEYLMVTKDYNPERLNLEIMDGVVVAASVG